MACWRKGRGADNHSPLSTAPGSVPWWWHRGQTCWACPGRAGLCRRPAAPLWTHMRKGRRWALQLGRWHLVSHSSWIRKGGGGGVVQWGMRDSGLCDGKLFSKASWALTTATSVIEAKETSLTYIQRGPTSWKGPKINCLMEEKELLIWIFQIGVSLHWSHSPGWQTGVMSVEA